MERERNQVLVQLGHAAGGELLAGLDHDLQPQREAPRIECLVRARGPALPQIVVEHGGQLLGGGQRDKLAGVLEPDAVDEQPERARGQRLHALDEVRIVEDAVQELARPRRHRTERVPLSIAAPHRAISSPTAVRDNDGGWVCGQSARCAARCRIRRRPRATTSAILPSMAVDGPRTRTTAAGDSSMRDTTQVAPAGAVVNESGRPWPPGDESRARFQVGVEIARGGMGRVVAARDRRLGPRRRHQGAARRRHRHAAALRARGAHHRAPAAPGHRAGLRGRPLAVRRAVLRDAPGVGRPLLDA